MLFERKDCNLYLLTPSTDLRKAYTDGAFPGTLFWKSKGE